MKILLLGVTGNVGSRALPALIKHGHTVVAYVRSPGKLTPAIRADLASVVTGSATDTPALKDALLSHNCDAIFHAAGLAKPWGRSYDGEYNAIFAAVIAAVVQARRERRGTAIRAWLMSGFPMMDSIYPPRLIGDYMPLYPEHRNNLALIRAQDEKDIVWTLFCASAMTPRHKVARIPAPDDCSAENVVASADSPPGWQSTLGWVPLLGPYLNILLQASGYSISMEDGLDFVATDFSKGLQSEFGGRRVAFKLKVRAAE
ncbi:hypothetical protein G7046_g855 [Stylonectria norvegica]|nr:hypothetical protein G7046_g855 [Stylonectria norvegica]